MQKTGPVWALGAMSGTSLDGVDAALVLTDGERILDFGETGYRPYDADEQVILRAQLAHQHIAAEEANLTNSPVAAFFIQHPIC